ncbi:MAG: hypothetical protein LDLANPLL_02736 [Turneriella sp.]|nr:hypothetical protein [Turneriella sp.]
MTHLVLASLRNRWVIALLTALSVAMGVFLFAGVEKVRLGARKSFTQTASGTHLIVGARSGQIPLLLSSLFHIGQPTQNISYRSFLKYKKNPQVAWALPLSIGDSHRGFRVVGTNADLLKFYRFGDRQKVEIQDGNFSLGRFKATLGWNVARDLGYRVGDKIVLTHGITDVVGIHDHDENPFVVEAVLKPTGTAFDKAIFISLQSMELIHADTYGEDSNIHDEHALYAPIKIKNISSILLGVKEPTDILPLLREINEDTEEPLTAILPGVVLSEIWNMVGYAESALKLISFLVMATAIAGLFIALYASLAERYREMAILRALGASPTKIASLLIAESFFITLCGIFLGYFLFFLVSFLFKEALSQWMNVRLSVLPLAYGEIIFLAALIIVSILVAMVPAYILYRRALGQTLQVMR